MPITKTIFHATLFMGCALMLPFTTAGAQSAGSSAPSATATTTAKPAPASSADTDHASSYYHYGLAKIYEDQAVANGRQDLATQAIEQYKLALQADPDSRVLENGLANLYFRLGRIREAVSAAQEQITRHPDDVDAHELLGHVYLRSLGDGQNPQSGEMLQAAIKEYETIAKLKPQDVETHLLLGQLYGLAHDSAKAEEQFKAAQKIDPNSEEVVLSMARLYSEQGDLQHAAKVIESVPADDRSARMDFALAGIYDQLKQPKNAVKAYRAAVDEDPDNADAKRGLAAALTAAGEMDEAAKVYAQILGADPQDAQALIREADIERQQGHYEQALATLKKAQALVSDNVELSYNLALVYDALGRFDDSISTLKQLLTATLPPDGRYSDADRSNRALFLDRLAIVDREANRTDDAVAAYKEMSQLGGDFQARGAGGVVDAYRDAHNWKAALDAAAAAAKAMPTNHDVQLTYARQLADSGKVDEALKLAKAQLAGTPDDRDVFFTVADINVRDKRWKDASEALDKAEGLATKPEEKAFVAYYRGTVAERQKLFDQAEIEFRKGLELSPDFAPIENYLGYMLAERGQKLDEAVAMLKKVVAFDPQNGAYLDSLAWAYYKQGQYALAEDYERKAALRMSNDPTVLDHLGEINAKTGKLSLAIDEWQRSLAQYATSLPPEADPADVAKVQHKLENARVKLAHVNAPTK
ncbi:MAG TPA: tetratricopeptide repeat protein [Acidobacteriaceae bacterium]